MRPPRSKCNSPAYFFKFIPPGLKSQLEIPSSFRKYIKNKSHSKTAILRRGYQEWLVNIDGWAFGEGWEIFVRENGVQDYDFLIFKHEGNMVFDTMVFDPSCCEKEYPTTQIKIMQAEKPCPEVKEIGKHEMDIDASKKTSKRKHTYIKKSTKSLLKSSDHDHCSYFNGTLTSCCKYRLYLPTDFTRSNGISSTGKLILKYGQTQKLWMADLNICTRNSYCIGRGWHDFYIENGLRDQDPFKLEIVQTGIKPIAIFHRLSEETPKQKAATVMLETEDSSSHPYFDTTLRQYSISTMTLYVPKNFGLANRLRDGDIILRNEGNKGSWTAKLANRSGKHFVIQRGLYEFCVANRLSEGDNLRFKLIQNGEKHVATITRLSEETSKQKAATVKLETEDSSSHPYFDATFKQYSISSMTLYVPKNFGFANRLKDGEITLRNEGYKGSWIAKLANRSGKYFVIQHGLYEFCVANGLSEGDNVRFKLIQNGEKRVATISRALKATPKVKAVQNVTPSPKVKEVQIVTPKVRAVQNPYFMSTATAHCFKWSFVNVPIDFARSNGLVNMNGEIDVIDEKQRVWSANLSSTHDRVRLRHFREIWVANGLNEGDEFLLELVHITQKPLMKFHSMKTDCSSVR